ncbi:MAG: hypothetical protein R2720_09075 [Candidatus Nanopelagicales bacterium]
MTVVPHAGSRRTVLTRTAPAARGTRTGVMSSSAFVIGALSVMTIGLLALLVLNTALAKGSFRAHELRVQKADLAQREQALRAQIETASSPVTLAKRAKELGLVPATAPVFIRLSDGTILGVPYAAGLPLDPATGAPVTSAGVPEPVPSDPASDPNTVGEPKATAPLATPEPSESAPVSDGVATAPGTDTEQPLGITGG